MTGTLSSWLLTFIVIAAVLLIALTGLVAARAEAPPERRALSASGSDA